MRKVAIVAIAIFVLAAAGAVWANDCHEGGNGCTMEGCPGNGQTMKQVSGAVTAISPRHDAIRVKVGDKSLTLYVHANCPNKDAMKKQIAKLQVGGTVKATFYVLNSKFYLCQLGQPSCH